MEVFKLKYLKPIIYQTRSLFAYVPRAFNTVDAERLKLVGPNRLCAEWVLKNGGGVTFVEAPNRMERNYNALPGEDINVTVKVIDASNSSIMQEGFQHLIGCQSISQIILHNCKHLEGEALKELAYVQATLTHLQVSGCYNINDSGMLHCKNLHNLKELKVFDMRFVKNMDQVVCELEQLLPGCKFDLPS